MKLTVLKKFGENEANSDIEVGDEVEAKGLISAGLCKEFVEETDEDIIESFKAIAYEQAKKALSEQVASAAKKSKSGLRVDSVHDNYQDDPQGACKNFGVFAKEFGAFKKTGEMTDNFQKAVTLSDTNNESLLSDGGALVPDQMSATILEHSMVNKELNLLERATTLTVSGNSMTFGELDNADQSADATRFGGIQPYWLGEADAKAKSKPQFKESNYRLHKLAVLVPVSDELLQDSVALESKINSGTGAAIIDKINQAIIGGNGVNKPQGIIGYSGTVVSPTDANRTAAAPITAVGLTGMYDRLLNKSNPVWLINQELRSALSLLVVGDKPALLPNNLTGQPFQNLMGFPVVWTDICKAPSTIGDIILANMAGYQAIVKGGIQSAVSIHLYFDQDITAFRFVFRVDGKPMFSQTTAPLNGVNTMGSFVTLAKTA